MNCITRKCDKRVKQFIVAKEHAENPRTCEVGELKKLFGYYQYKAPNTSSYQCDNLDSLYHDEVYHEMTKSWKPDNYIIIPFNKSFNEYSSKLALAGDEVCSYCKRFLCKRAKTKNNNKESDFNCVMRHIRNSIAHGRVFVINGGNSIKVLFEDYDTRNKTISARIVCNQSDLRKWKELINKYIEKQRKETCQS